MWIRLHKITSGGSEHNGSKWVPYLNPSQPYSCDVGGVLKGSWIGFPWCWESSGSRMAVRPIVVDFPIYVHRLFTCKFMFGRNNCVIDVTIFSYNDCMNVIRHRYAMTKTSLQDSVYGKCPQLLPLLSPFSPGAPFQIFIRGGHGPTHFSESKIERKMHSNHLFDRRL